MTREEAVELLTDILFEASGHLAEELNSNWLLSEIERKIGSINYEEIE